MSERDLGAMGPTTGPLSREAMQEILDGVGELAGWDFSSVRDVLDPLPWDYMTLVPRFLSQTDRVLDIGTGGGERLLRFAPHFAYGVGVDVSPEMIDQARRNKAASDVDNVEFRLTDAFALDVPSLLFWLKSVPLPEPFDLEKHWQGVNRILRTCTTSRGIESNEHRELLIVRKPAGAR